MEEKEREVTEMKEFLIQRVDRVEILLKQMAKLLAMNTNYATMISGPSYNSTKLKFIQLSRVDMQKMLAVIVVDGNIVKNTFFDIEEDMTDQELLSLNLLLNSNLNGLTIQEINLGIIKKMEEEAGIHSSVVKHVLDAVADVIRVDDDVQIYTSSTPTSLNIRSFRTARRPAS